MSHALANGGIFLTQTLFDLFILVLLLRMILNWGRVDYFNPAAQLILRLTNPVISPLRKIIPVVRGIEWATPMAVVIFEIIKFSLVPVLAAKAPSIIGTVILSIGDPIKMVINIFFYAILIQAILSWVQPMHSPLAYLLQQVTSPVMRPIQRYLPPVSGFDLSPVAAMIALQLINIVVVQPFLSKGYALVFTG